MLSFLSLSCGQPERKSSSCVYTDRQCMVFTSVGIDLIGQLNRGAIGCENS